MAINRYDKPATAKYINTYVPLPFRELMGAGQMASRNMDKNLGVMSTFESAVDQLKGIPNTTDELVANKIKTDISNLVTEYSSKNLMDPTVSYKFLQEAKKIANPVVISKITESRQNWEKNEALRQQMNLAGKYDPALDRNDPAKNTKFSSLTNGVYLYNTPIGVDRSKLGRELFYPSMQNPSKSKTVKDDYGRIYDVLSFDEQDAREQVDKNWGIYQNDPRTRTVTESSLVNLGFSDEQINNILNHPDLYKQYATEALVELASPYYITKSSNISYQPQYMGDKKGEGEFPSPLSVSDLTKLDEGATKNLSKVYKSTLDNLKKNEVIAYNKALFNIETAGINLIDYTDENGMLNLGAIRNILKESGNDNALQSVEEAIKARNDKLAFYSSVEQAQNYNASLVNDELLKNKKLSSIIDDLDPDKLTYGHLSNIYGYLGDADRIGILTKSDLKDVASEIVSQLSIFSPHPERYTEGKFLKKSLYDIQDDAFKKVLYKHKGEYTEKQIEKELKNLSSGKNDLVNNIWKEVRPIQEGLKDKFIDVKSRIVGTELTKDITIPSRSDEYVSTTGRNKSQIGDTDLLVNLTNFMQNPDNYEIDMSLLENKNNRKFKAKHLSDLKDEIRKGDRFIDKNSSWGLNINTNTGDIKLYVETYRKGDTENSKKDKITIPIKINNEENLSNILASLFKKGRGDVAEIITQMPSIINDIKTTDFSSGETWYRQFKIGKNKATIGLYFDPQDNLFKFNAVGIPGDKPEIKKVFNTYNEAVSNVAQLLFNLSGIR